jgi:PKD repeat protein
VTSGTVSNSIFVEVTDNLPPVAQLVASPTNPSVGQLVSFSAAGSSDPDGSIVAYRWDFGDGDTAFGRQVTHRYDTANTFNVLLVVTDDDGTTASATQLIRVAPAGSDAASQDPD